MISCRNIARLVLSDQIDSQTWLKRMEIRMHLLMCRLCSRLFRQNKDLGEAVKRIPDSAPEDLEERLIARLSR